MYTQARSSCHFCLYSYRKQKIGKSTLQYEGLKGDSQIHEEKCAEKLLLHNAALNEARKCVEQISGKLASLSSKPKLLSNLSLEPFLAMEESYTTKLTTHANNEFDQVEYYIFRKSFSFKVII